MKRKLQVLAGILFGLFLLWLLFRDTDWRAVATSIRNANPWWLLVMQLPIWASFFARIRRWHYIVRSAKPVPFRTLFTATQIGFLANFILPLRIGELVRAYVLARRANLRFPRCVALVALDRVADLFGLLACTVFAIAAVQRAETVVLPPGTFGNADPIHFAPSLVRTGATGALAGLVLVAGAMVLLYARQEWFLRTSDRVVGWVSQSLAARVRALLDHFAQGLQVFRSPADMLRAIAWSVVVWGCFVLGTAAAMEAFGLDYPWYTPFLMQVLVAVAVSMPGAPGFVGQFHVAIVVGVLMTMPNADPAEAKALALVTHFLNFIPVVVAGLISLAMEQTGLLELTRESAEAESLLETETPAEQID